MNWARTDGTTVDYRTRRIPDKSYITSWTTSDKDGTKHDWLASEWPKYTDLSLALILKGAPCTFDGVELALTFENSIGYYSLYGWDAGQSQFECRLLRSEDRK